MGIMNEQTIREALKGIVSKELGYTVESVIRTIIKRVMYMVILAR